MEIKPINTDNDYREVLKEIERLFNAAPGTPDGDKLDVLITLVTVYEANHFPIQLPDPVEAIRYHMERLGLTQKDLEKFIGVPSRVSDILNRKRPLTLNMIRNLNKGLGVSLEILTQEYETAIKEPIYSAGYSSSSIGTPIIVFVNTGNSGEIHPNDYPLNHTYTEIEMNYAMVYNYGPTSGTTSKPSDRLPYIYSDSGGVVQ
jgi:HTH-type transcriptional regulator/antitoxin HigA